MKKNYLFKATLLLCTMLLLTVVSCKKGLELAKDKKAVIQDVNPPGNPKGTVHTLNFANHTTLHLVETKNGQYYMGGDMVLSNEQVAMLMKDTINPRKPTKHVQSTFIMELNKRWPNKIVYYTLNNPINQTTISNAIAHWESKTDIRFVLRTTQQNYVTFSCCPDNGASGDSQVGMVGGQQLLRLIDNAPLQTVIHEIGHTVGLYHEQQRADRGLYVIINYGNITPGYKPNYDTYAEQGKLGSESGPYDFNSIMGYSSYYGPPASYAGNPALQIRKLDGTGFSQGTVLSAGDIQGVKLLYQPVYISYENIETVYESSEFVDNRDQEVSVSFWSDAAHTIPGAPRTTRFLIYHARSTYIDQYNGYQYQVLQSTPSGVGIGGGGLIYLGKMEQRMFYNQRMDLEPGSYSESLGLSQIQ